MSILSYVAVDGICPIDQCEHYSKNWNNNWHDRICKVENSLSFLCLYSFLGIRHLPLESMVVNNIFFIEQLNDSEEYNLTQCTNFPSCIGSISINFQCFLLYLLTMTIDNDNFKFKLCTVLSISSLERDIPQPQPWQSKDNELYSQRLFYSARARGLVCLVKDQISIL